MVNTPHQIERDPVTRNKKISIALISIVALLGCVVAADWLWDDWTSKGYGYVEAGIEPVSGAKLIYIKFEKHSDILPDGETSWVYQLPSTYYEDLYKDCSKIGYKTGIYMDRIYTEADRYIERDKPGCYLYKEDKHEVVVAQFSGDKLIVEDT